jgi:hypothetical protein
MTTVRDGVAIALERAGVASGPMEDSDVHAPSNNIDAATDEVILDMCAPEGVKCSYLPYCAKTVEMGQSRDAQRFRSAAAQR